MFFRSKNGNCEFDHKKIMDIIYNIKYDGFFNFCHSLILILNDKSIKGGKFYIFTDIKEKSYKRDAPY